MDVANLVFGAWKTTGCPQPFGKYDCQREGKPALAPWYGAKRTQANKFPPILLSSLHIPTPLLSAGPTGVSWTCPDATRNIPTPRTGAAPERRRQMRGPSMHSRP